MYVIVYNANLFFSVHKHYLSTILREKLHTLMCSTAKHSCTSLCEIMCKLEVEREDPLHIVYELENPKPVFGITFNLFQQKDDALLVDNASTLDTS